MKLAVSFTNLGPYHLARLRALAVAMGREGGSVVAYETADREAKYPWRRGGGDEPFAWSTLVPGGALERVPDAECRGAMLDALERDRPDAVAVAGYVRPECLAALAWARRRGRIAVLMSESGALDRPRVWWKEAVKSRRVRRFHAALVGGPRHRDYLVALGLSPDRIALGYNAVDHEGFARRAEAARRAANDTREIPRRPFFLSVARFGPEKNLPALVRAFGRYRRGSARDPGWELVLCGDGPEAPAVEQFIRSEGLVDAVHRPGFLQAEDQAPFHASAGAFVLPSLSEPWGLVVNEAAACRLPLLVSDRAGCAETLVPDPPGTTGWRFDPRDESAMAAALTRMAEASDLARSEMGRRAAETVARWGPERFASGMLEALAMASRGGHPAASRTAAATLTRSRM
jgi:glycosyltransferase involved in cell wall biosynthesis